MTPEKEIKQVVARMAGVTEQQIVQRMHDFNESIEARSAANRPPQIVESQPAPAESRIETTEQSLQARPFTQGTGAQQNAAGTASSNGTAALPIIQMIMNSNGTAVYVDVNANITGTV